jgi:crotonobetainyl-CoA:carnitine CoA-transferase CaiB-like acyl-CoA transferase
VTTTNTDVMGQPRPEPHAGGEPPLTGLRVLEFGQLLAGPYVGTLLGDFGADVVKVEVPGKGDPMREWGRLRHNDHSLWWSTLSRNKRSVGLNLRTERGRSLAAELCATADVVLENFRPGTMERWGLGPDDVLRDNPRCVYARVSGYGNTPSRYRDRPGFASAGEAIGGLRYINGHPGEAPPRAGISLGDTLAAQSAFQGIVLALYARDARGGAGQVVDASITDACFAMLESAVLEYEMTGVVRQPTGSRLPKIAPSNVYRSRDDKWVVIAANHDTLWRRLANLLGKPELGEDPRFVDHMARGEHEDLLDEIISEWAAQHDAAEIDRMCEEAGVVSAPVYTVADIAEDPYFSERELLIDHEDDVHGQMRLPGVVPKLSATPGSVRAPARWTVGADTEAVLREVGVDRAELSTLAREGDVELPE